MMTPDRKQAPHSRAIENINLLRPETFEPGNGVKVFCFNSGDQDLVRIEWIFNNVGFNPDSPLLNSAVNTMLTEGTKTLTAAQIADKIDFYGAFIQVEHGFDNSQVTLFTLNKHLKHTLPVIKDVITNSIFPQKELETYIRNHQQKLQVGLQKNDVVARRTFSKAVYGNTPYGTVAELETYEKLSRDDMQAHFERMYQPANCTIIIAGKIEKDTLELIAEHFGAGWSGSEIDAGVLRFKPEPSPEHFYFVEKPDALQSAIRMGRPSITRNHPDFPALQVLNTVLGGYFGSRLMANIREDKGYTYGIGSGLSSLKHGGALFIATEVGAEVCKAAIGEIEAELKQLREELIPEDELSRVRNFMLGSLLGSLENVFSHADKFKNIHFAGIGYEYYDRYTETIKTVQAERLRQLAGQYLDPAVFYKVIVGKY